jgi:peptidoglycan/LPS O-acetylase OafA/YrhL
VQTPTVAATDRASAADVTMSSRAFGRVPALDGLRGIAILLVLAHHFALYTLEPPSADAWWKPIFTLAEFGWVGVDLFFVLSGFLITTILWRAKEREHFFRDFYARRALRIFPLYFGCLVLFTGVLPWLAPENLRLQAWAQQSAWYWSYTVNFLLARNNDWSASSGQGLEHFWSLAVEEQFYLLWPMAVYRLRRRALILTTVGCGLVSIGLRLALLTSGHAMAAYVLMPARMDALAAGALVALLATKPGLLRRLRTHAALVGAVAAIALMYLLLTRGTFWGDVTVETIGFACIAAASAAILVGALTFDPLSRICEIRVLRFFGQYSYGLYVLHHPLLLLLPATAVTTMFLGYVDSTVAARALAVLSLGGLSIAAAIASWHLWERPFLRMQVRFRGRGDGTERVGDAHVATTRTKLDSQPQRG